MKRLRIRGDLAVVALGAVLAFAIRSTSHRFDVQLAGVIIMLAGASAMLIRIAWSRYVSSIEPDADTIPATIDPSVRPVIDPLFDDTPLIPQHGDVVQAPTALLEPVREAEPEFAGPAEPAPVVRQGRVYHRLPTRQRRPEEYVSEPDIYTLGGRPVGWRRRRQNRR